jgi:putative transposase
MKASKFTEAQRAFILKQADEGVPVGGICRKAGVSQATLYAWRKKYAGMTAPEMRGLKALEDENARLKKLVAELSLDREMLHDVVRRKLVRQCFSYHWRSIGSPCPEAEAGCDGSGRLGRDGGQGLLRAAREPLDLSVPFAPVTGR